MLRRRIASWALALIVFQVAVVFAAPLMSCCPSSSHSAAVQDKDCCPAGSHRAGECPLHARSKTAKVSCRMQCDAPHGAQFLLGSVGVLPRPILITVSLTDRGAARVASTTAEPRTDIPASPPPKTL